MRGLETLIDNGRKKTWKSVERELETRQTTGNCLHHSSTRGIPRKGGRGNGEVRSEGSGQIRKLKSPRSVFRQSRHFCPGTTCACRGGGGEKRRFVKQKRKGSGMFMTKGEFIGGLEIGREAT